MATYKIVYDRDSGVVTELSIEYALLQRMPLKNEYELHLCSVKDGSFFKEASDADGVSAFIPFTEEVLDRMPACRVVAVPALGTDFIHRKPAVERGICMCNVPSYCVEEVAAHTAALLLDGVRRIARQDRRLKEGYWDWEERGRQRRLSSTTYGLVSFGAIPRRAAAMMKGFGVGLAAYDPFLTDDIFEKMGVRRAGSIEELFSICDMVSVHTPYTPQTRHMISDAQFAAIPDSMILVVTGRGGVVDEEALKRAIESGKISAAGLDVIEDEVEYRSVLTSMKEVTLTPHCAYYSEEAEKELRETNLLEILDVLEDGKLPRNLVNKELTEIRL